MYPGKFAELTPDKPAIIMAGSGEVVTYKQLDDRSNQLAQLMWSAGLRPGDHVALFADNHPRYFEVVWAALRSGLYLTTINRYLQADEASYVVQDCGAKVLVATEQCADVAGALLDDIPACTTRLMIGAAAPGFDDYLEALAAHPAEPLAQQPRGELMLYSSGSTGQPKGIKRPLSGTLVSDEGPQLLLFTALFGFTDETVYLSPAPLYHAAPMLFCGGAHRLGATVVVLEKFDALGALQAIEKHRVTHSQWVPTMFTRMLRLDEAERTAVDLSSHKLALHAAAPCPVQIKHQMIDWWGPIISEYYAGTEGNGFCYVNAQDWLEHPGTVGRSLMGPIRICDDDGVEQPTGEPGTVYFEAEQMPFAYHNDAAKTKSAQHPAHPNWSTLGDVGYLDADGFLFLTDRKAFMIISGGVNIYPAEIEGEMVMHPRVLDVAVFGVPNEEMGEEVKAVVQLDDGGEGDPQLEAELIAWSRQRLAHYKVPRSIDFMVELPRLPTGKLYKKPLRDKYWEGHASKLG